MLPKQWSLYLGKMEVIVVVVADSYNYGAPRKEEANSYVFSCGSIAKASRLFSVIRACLYLVQTFLTFGLVSEESCHPHMLGFYLVRLVWVLAPTAKLAIAGAILGSSLLRCDLVRFRSLALCRSARVSPSRSSLRAVRHPMNSMAS